MLLTNSWFVIVQRVLTYRKHGLGPENVVSGLTERERQATHGAAACVLSRTPHSLRSSRRLRVSASGANTRGHKLASLRVVFPALLVVFLVLAQPWANGVCATVVNHYEYLLIDGSVSVYDIDNGFSLVKKINLPTSGTRGEVAHAGTGMMYVSYGSDSTGPGSLLKYDLVHDKVVWTRSYSFGIDSMSISPDGTIIYMPTGELSSGGTWEVIDAATGNVKGTIESGGSGPHNTVVNAAGTHVYMGPRNTNYLVEADTSTHQLIANIGPIKTWNGNGVRPFTINTTETLAFITATGLLGFQVGDISTGNILYDVPINGFTWNGTGVSAPSHGISISPDDREIYVIDSPNSYVHVYDITGLPSSAPKQVANISLIGKMTGTQSPCAYDCARVGWLHHSRDGHYVFVGDSGDVIDTGTRRTVGRIPAMANSRVETEIDFQNGLPVWAMNNRSSIGTVSGASGAPAITSATSASGIVDTAGFKYLITATNSPTSYGASILPSGLSVDTSTGLISGTPTKAGIYSVVISASNSAGTGRAILTLTINSPSPFITVQANSIQGSAVGSVSLPFPTANTAGNMILAFVRASTTTQKVTVTDSLGNTYRDAVMQVQNADGHQVHVFYAPNIKGGANTVKATFSATNNHPYLAVWEYKGLNASVPLDRVAAAQGSSTTASCGPTATTTSPSELAFAAMGMPSSYTGNVTQGAGWSLLTQDTSTSRAASESKTLSSTATVTGQFSVSPSTNWTCVTATFKHK